MILLPAIDLYDGKVVRLTKGDYAQMTVYRDDPVAQAADFQAAGAKWLHTVDLEGAKDGTTPNFPVIAAICKKTDLKVEIGGGIRSLDTIQKYLDAGVSRVILGTAAVTDPKFLERALDRFGSQAAVGVDLKDGAIAIKGWKETAPERAEDISKDGMLGGANVELYQTLSQQFPLDFIASGGVSSISDLQKLKDLGLYGAILGKALYTGALDLKTALKEVE